MLSLHEIKKILKQIEEKTKNCPPPGADFIIDRWGRDPFLLLVYCILSLRTRDATSVKIGLQLFDVIRTPAQFCEISVEELTKLIHGVGFYKRKAIQIKKSAEIIVKKFHGNVPDKEEDLLSLPGVGRKTMNLVLQQAFLKPAFCVDTHVHRIANKLRFVHTKTPEETEFALKKLLPKSMWAACNRLLLVYGQSVCISHKHQCADSVEKHPVKKAKKN